MLMQELQRVVLLSCILKNKLNIHYTTTNYLQKRKVYSHHFLLLFLLHKLLCIKLKIPLLLLVTVFALLYTSAASGHLS